MKLRNAPKDARKSATRARRSFFGGAREARGTAKGSTRAIRGEAKGTARGMLGRARGSARAARADARAMRHRARGSARGAKANVTKGYFRARMKATKAVADRRADGTSKKTVGAAGALGALGAYFFDPESGNRRREATRERAAAFARKATDRVRRQAEHRKDQVDGKIEVAESAASPDKPAADDQDLGDRNTVVNSAVRS